MKVIPKTIQEIDRKIGSSSYRSPATQLWTLLRAEKKPMGFDEMQGKFLSKLSKQKMSKQLESVFKKTVNELEAANFLYRFNSTFYPVDKNF